MDPQARPEIAFPETSRRVVLPGEAVSGRLDRALADAWPDLSRSRVQALIRAGAVTVDGDTVLDPSARPVPDSTVELTEPAPVEAAPRPEPIALAVVHEDADLLVIDKPAGLVVHPGAGNGTGTLVNALLAHCGASLSGIGGVLRPGIVHRLDKDTTGLLVVAKNDRTHRSLTEQFADHGRTGPLERAYRAVVWGVPEPRRGRIEAALDRSPASREKMAVVPEGRGRHAVTRYAVEAVFGGGAASLLRLELETGRTHQIRVHMAHLRHPLLGDTVYGSGFLTAAARLTEDGRGALAALRRQALHAALLQFRHPADDAIMRFESPLPADLVRLVDALGAGGPGSAGHGPVTR